MTTPHPDHARLQELWPAIEQYQELATRHGVDDIFQDNGGKLLQVLLIANLVNIPGRLGNDAKDANGNELELKSVNTQKTRSFSTHHHLNPTILDKYQQVDWIFAVYDGITLTTVYRVTPDALAPYFAKWREKWHDEGGRDINNPKIPLGFVERVGTKIYSSTDD